MSLSRWVRQFLPVLLLSASTSVVIPLGVFLNNYEELNFTPFDFLPTHLVVFGIVFLILVGIRKLLLRWGEAGTVDSLISVQFYLVWIQANFLLWDYGQIESGDWYRKWHFGVIDGLLWMGAFAATLRFKGRLAPLFARANLYAGGLVLITFLSYLVQIPYSKTRYVLDTEGRFTFSKKRNVIVLLLDEVQSDIAQKIIFEDPELLKAFSGFEIFRNFMSNTKSTAISVPMILTGRYFDNSVPFDDFVREGLIHHSILSLYKNSGYDSDLYPNSIYFRNAYIDPSYVSNIRPNDKYNYLYSLQVYDYAFFSSLPHFAKPLAYDDHRWFLSSHSNWIKIINRLVNGRKTRHSKTQEALPYGDSDTRFFLSAKTGMERVDGAPRMKFFHLSGAHTPFNLSETGERIESGTYRDKLHYKLKLLAGFIGDLKAQGSFENSRLIVLSDHGSGRSEETRKILDPITGQVSRHSYHSSRANALLMVKEPGAQAAKVRVNDAPVSSIDLYGMFEESLHGRSFAASAARFDPQRVRRFFSFGWKDYRPYVKKYHEYLVKGPVWKADSFISHHDHPPGFDPADCHMDQHTKD